MRVEITNLRFCLDKASELTELYQQYIIAADSPKKSVMDLMWICGEYLQKKIQVAELDSPLPHDSIRGLYMLLTGSYVIILNPGLDENWRRYVLAKELFHVILDQPEYRITAIHDHLQEVAIAFPAFDSTPGLAVVSEAMAEIAAMQFLFPYKRRQTEAKPCDYAQVAAKYGIPQVHIERYLSDPYMATFGALER